MSYNHKKKHWPLNWSTRVVITIRATAFPRQHFGEFVKLCQGNISSLCFTFAVGAGWKVCLLAPFNHVFYKWWQFGAFQREERKSFNPPFFFPWPSSRVRILLRRCTTQFLPFAPKDLEEVDPDPEPGVLADIEALGVCAGVLSFPVVLGVVEQDRLTDWGVLCLPTLPGVLRLRDSGIMNSLPIPLCLDVLLQVWQVAIDTKVAISDWQVPVSVGFQWSK